MGGMRRGVRKERVVWRGGIARLLEPHDEHGCGEVGPGGSCGMGWLFSWLVLLAEEVVDGVGAVGDE